MDRTFLDVNHIKIFFKSLLGAMEIKTKINKRDIIKLQRFYTAKEIILKKIKREQVLIRDQILHIYLFVHSFIQQIQQSRMGEEKDG